MPPGELAGSALRRLRRLALSLVLGYAAALPLSRAAAAHAFTALLRGLRGKAGGRRTIAAALVRAAVRRGMGLPVAPPSDDDDGGDGGDGDSGGLVANDAGGAVGADEEELGDEAAAAADADDSGALGAGSSLGSVAPLAPAYVDLLRELLRPRLPRSCALLRAAADDGDGDGRGDGDNGNGIAAGSSSVPAAATHGAASGGPGGLGSELGGCSQVAALVHDCVMAEAVAVLRGFDLRYRRRQPTEATSAPGLALAVAGSAGAGASGGAGAGAGASGAGVSSASGVSSGEGALTVEPRSARDQLAFLGFARLVRSAWLVAGGRLQCEGQLAFF
jgi:hypothetical protein